MRSKRVIRYYCDFCNRGAFRKPDMVRHERGCTANPNRICGLCERIGQETADLTKSIEALAAGGIEKLKSLVEGCPACMLAATRAYNKENRSDEPIWFDYKKQHEEWWKETNDAEHAERYY